MYITAMTHRDELFDLTMRWLNDDIAPEDGKTITRIFLYESAISALVFGRMLTFLSDLFQGPLCMERIRQKQVLRQRLIQYLPEPKDRIQHLIRHFEADPEYYFPRLPIDALLVTTSDGQLAAIGRVKRLSRVAEKVSFRLVDALFREIQAEARRIAEWRAAETGVPLTHLISTDQEMQNDFMAAETAVARRFRVRNMRIARESLIINDLLGFKLIGEPGFIEQVPKALQHMHGITLCETERHTGDYNAINLLVEIELPAAEELDVKLKGFDWSIAERCGLSPREASLGVQNYLKHGAGTVRIEIILTTYDELMESEFGRSMHELRLLRLRQRPAYNGPIALNARYLIQYLLDLASSPTIDLAELPIKMYGRYLPETIAMAKNALFGTELDSGLLSAFCLNTDYLSQCCAAKQLAIGTYNHRTGQASP